MLHYTSLCLAAIVVVAHYKQDHVIHHQWLAVVCTSLINHTAQGRIYWVRLIDKLLCHVNTAYCVRRLMTVPFHSNEFIYCTNFVILFYLTYIYHIGKQCHGNNNVFWHGSVHVVSTIAVINTMYITDDLSL